MSSGLEPRRVVIVDDHPVFRAGLAAIFNGQPDLEVCGEAASVDAALPIIRAQHPDLVSLDLSMPGRSGLECLRELRTEEIECRVLVLTSHDAALYSERCFAEGADGFLEKHEAAERVLEAARTVLAGGRFTGDRSDRPAPESHRLHRLSPRELSVLELYGRGAGPRDIASTLHISVKTVEAHVGNIKRKLGIRDSRTLLRYAVSWLKDL
ncbi:MAG: response regulator transcription factor [Myxococcota bacterium]